MSPDETHTTDYLTQAVQQLSTAQRSTTLSPEVASDVELVIDTANRRAAGQRFRLGPARAAAGRLREAVLAGSLPPKANALACQTLRVVDLLAKDL